MKMSEIQNTPKTPEQQRISALKRSKDLATKALETERQRQKIAKAQTQLNSLKAPETSK